MQWGEIKNMSEVSCQKCEAKINEKEFLASYKVCSECNHHHNLNAYEWLSLLADQETFTEFDTNLRTINLLNFPDYEEKMAADIAKTGLKSEMLTGKAEIGGYKTAIGIGDFRVRGGSMGAVIGEKIARLFERAIEERLPVIIVSPFGGGMRMYEGTIALMQMAKTAAACARHSKAGLFYISIITTVTLGGNAASFASLGHIIIAEPGAIYGFAGYRTRSAIGLEMPPEVQSAEFQLKYGMIDMVAQRKDLRGTLIDLLDFCSD